MIHRSDPDIVKRLNLFASLAAIFSVVVGLSVLAGWTLDIAALVTWGDGTAVAPNSAACFLFAGISLWLLRESNRRPLASARKRAAKALAAMASLVGLLTLVERLFRRDIGIDRLLLLRPPGPQTAGARILMSPVVAGAFLLLGVALLGIDWRTRRKKWPAQFLCLGAAFAPIFGLLGLMLGPRVSPITLGLAAVAGFVALTAGLLCCRPTWAMGGLLTRQSRGKLARLAVELSQQAEDLEHSRQALEAQQLMLQSVLNSMVEGLAAADTQGKFILWNPAAERIIGLGAADLSPGKWSAHYGIYLPDMVTPFPTERTPLQLGIHGEASSAEMFIRHPDLSQGTWIECNGAPLRDKDGVLVGGVVAFRDITRRKVDELKIRKFNEELEERIVERTAQLETANHELEAFSYSVSHDLRTPLRHIAGFSRILMNDFGAEWPPEAKGHLGRIDDAVIRMGMLVDGLLSVARLGRQSLKLRPTELNAIVAEAVSVLQPECEGREVEWRIAPLPALECDGVLMGQVFQNLLGNALKYSRGRSKAVIEVDSVQHAGEPAVIFVRDNGAGFNMQYAEKLFGVFQRMHTEAEFEGTGVGLATVQRIVQKHGGRIWAEAETDHGATFYFTLSGDERAEMAAEVTPAGAQRLTTRVR